MNFKKFLRKNWIFIPLIFSIFIFVISIWDSKYYIGGDLIVPIIPLNNLKKILLWSEGVESFHYLESFWYLFYYILSLLGIKTFVIQKILLTALFISGFAFTFFSYRQLFKNTKFDEVYLAVVAGVTYTFNPVFFLMPNGYLPLYGFPVCFYLILKFVRSGKLYFALLFAILLNLFFFTELPQPKLSIVFVMAVCLLLFLYKYLSEIKIRELLLRVATLFTVVFLLNLWVFVPLLYSTLNGAVGGFASGVTSFNGMADYKIADLFYIGRFFNLNTITSYSKLKDFLQSPAFVVFSLLQWFFLAFGISRLRLDRKERVILSTLILFTLIFVFIAKGANPPFGDLYKYFVAYFPLGKIFRTTSSVVLGGLFFFSCAFTLSLFFVFKNNKRILYAIIIFQIVLFYPIYFGSKFYNQQGQKSQEKGYTIPPEYFEMVKKLDNLGGDSKVLSLPLINGYTNKKWGYFGPDLVSWMTSTPIIYRSGDYSPSLVKRETEIVNLHNFGFNFLNSVNYILLQKDSLSVVGGVGRDNKSIDLVDDSKYFELFKVKDSEYLPHIYALSEAIQFSGDLGRVFRVPTFSKFKKGSGIFYIDKLNKNPNLEPSLFVNVSSKIETPFSVSDIRWDDSLSWPDSSTNPTSPKYFLVKFKEFITTLTIFSPLERVDRLLWLSAKRVQEIRIFNLAQQPSDFVFSDCERKIKDLVNILISVDVKKRDEDYWDAVEKSLIYMKHSIDILRKMDLNKSYKIESRYNQLLDWAKKESQIDCGNYCYDIEVPKDGYYKIFLDKKSVVDSGGDLEAVSLDLKEDLKNKISSEDVEGSWYEMGNDRYLDSNKIYRALLNFPEPPNLVDANSWQDGAAVFPNGGLGILTLSKSYNLEKNYKVKDDADGQDHFVIGDSLKYKNIKNWEIYEKYKISFDYSTNNGTLGIMLIEDFTDSDMGVTKNILFHEVMKNSSADTEGTQAICNWKESGVCFSHFEKTVSASFGANSASIFIYVTPDVGALSNTEIQNVKVQKVLDPVLALVMPAKISPPIKSIPEIKYSKINSTKYLVGITDAREPFTLIFNEKFHKDWKLFIVPEKPVSILGLIVSKIIGISEYGNLKTETKSYPDLKVMEGIHTNDTFSKFDFETIGMKSIGEESHLLINGYANAWTIKPEDVAGRESYKLILLFIPQIIFNVSLLISLSIFVFIIIISIIRLLINKVKNG